MVKMSAAKVSSDSEAVKSTMFNDSSGSEGGRESGECSRSPSPQVISQDSTTSSEAKPGPLKTAVSNLMTSLKPLCGSVVELVELDDSLAEESDDSVKVVSEVINDGEYFVVDKSCAVEVSNSVEILVVAEVDSGASKSETATETPKRRGPSVGLDMTKILTFDAVATSSGSRKKESGASRRACFNCGGDHPLSQCSEKLDARRISANKAAHYGNKQRGSLERYTDGAEGSSSFRPGQVSWELRDALGIGPNEIPDWIYRMRRKGLIEGYPPGYLKLAMSSNATLAFHTVDEVFEEGELANDDSEHFPPKVVPEKIISYPGFNHYVRSLRDRELFQIPPFFEFVRLHQDYATQQFYENRRQRAHTSGKRRRDGDGVASKKQKSSEMDNFDVVCMDVDGDDSDQRGGHIDGGSALLTPPPRPPVFTLSESESGEGLGQQQVHAAGSTTPTLGRTFSSPALLGSSTGVSCGTPIGSSNSERKMPDLCKFSEGIVPFSAEEESTPHRGLFRKLLSKLRTNSSSARR